MDDLEDMRNSLYRDIEILNRRAWEGRLTKAVVREWLDCFASDEDACHALYLLSQFMYFGQREIRAVLAAVYEDLFRTPIIHDIRRSADKELAVSEICKKYDTTLLNTRFLGCGNPAESGYHLLYYFRQESGLAKDLFVNPFQLTRWTNGIQRESWPELQHVVFIDDICGSGDQAIDYYMQIVAPVKAFLKSVQVHYLVMFATTDGLRRVRGESLYDRAESVYVLDESFRVFDSSSRYYGYDPKCMFTRADGEAWAERYGSRFRDGPLGYNNGQLMLGMYYNVPDNVPPMIWSDEGGWRPVFKRHHKLFLKEQLP